MDRPQLVFDTPFNVVAAFCRPEDAASAVRALTDHEVSHRIIQIRRPGDPVSDEEIAEARAEMQDELGASFAGPGLVTGEQAKGAFTGAAVLGGAGGLAGLLAGWVWGYAFDASLSGVTRLVIAAGIVGLAGTIVGMVAGGGLAYRLAGNPRGAPEHADEPTMAERDVLVAIHAGDRDVAEKAAGLLEEHGAERVHLVDGFGTPLPPQAAHPRPADPDGWWWARAGCG